MPKYRSIHCNEWCPGPIYIVLCLPYSSGKSNNRTSSTITLTEYDSYLCAQHNDFHLAAPHTSRSNVCKNCNCASQPPPLYTYRHPFHYRKKLSALTQYMYIAAYLVYKWGRMETKICCVCASTVYRAKHSSLRICGFSRSSANKEGFRKKTSLFSFE